MLVDILVERGSFDAVADLAEAYPLTVFPDAMGMPPENRRFLPPYGNMLFNAFGPCNEYFELAVADGSHPGADPRGSADCGAVAAQRRR